MQCPKCGTENAEGTSICRNCGFVLIIAGSAATSQPSRTSALAITSLVLGLLSFCTFFLTAPLAIIFGIISLVMIARSHGQLKGIGMAIAGIAVPAIMLPLIGVLMAILMPALAQVRFEAQQQVCSAHLKQLGIVLQEYAEDNSRQYPTADKWCDLLKPYYIDEKTLTCPSGGAGRCHYAINPQAEPNSPPDAVLLFETQGGWNQAGGIEILSTGNHRYKGDGCNILFNDGSVNFIRVEDINELRWTAGE